MDKITDGLPIHILIKGHIKTKCGINTDKEKISFVQHGLEFVCGNDDPFCAECKRLVKKK